MIEEVRRTSDPRVVLISQRGRSQHVSHCLLHEFEDVVGCVERADVLTYRGRLLDSAPLRKACRHPLGARIARRIASRRARLHRRYELAFVTVQNPGGILDLQPFDWLRDAATRLACWIEEFWPSTMAEHPGTVATLRDFDQIFTSHERTATLLEQATGRPASVLRTPVDALRFTAHGRRDDRPIDVYCMGRRLPGVHAAMKRLAAERNWFHLFDTRGGATVNDSSEHRELLASLIGRSRYFVVSPATPKGARASDECGLAARFFEGAAGGAVMIGSVPDVPAFSECFPWPDAVVPMADDGSDAAEVIAGLEQAPSRRLSISHRNMAESLRRHDAAHRWRAVLDAMGLAAEPALEQRERRCLALAEELAPEIEPTAAAADPMIHAIPFVADVGRGASA